MADVELVEMCECGKRWEDCADFLHTKGYTAEYVPLARAEDAEAVLERLAFGLQERGVIPGRNPDGENDDPEKALLLLDDWKARANELEDALRFLLGTIELGGATPEAKAEARAVLRLAPKGQQLATALDTPASRYRWRCPVHGWVDWREIRIGSHDQMAYHHGCNRDVERLSPFPTETSDDA